MVTISVVMATYNGERFLAAQIASILAQSTLPTELLVGDDCSTDDTVRTLNELLHGCALNYQVCVNERRLGVTANFERLIARASGDVIVLCDQDDEWAPNRLDVISQVFESRPEVIGVFSNADLIGPSSEPLPGSLWDAIGFGPSRQRHWRCGGVEILMRRNVVTGAALAFRSTERRYLMPISQHAWHDFWIAVLLVSSGTVLALDERLVRYRLHGANQAGVPSRGIARLRNPAMGNRQAHQDQLAQLRDLAERFASLHRPVPRSLTARIAFLEFRDSLPATWPTRAVAIVRRRRLADYWRFSSGLYSLALDVTKGGLREGSRSQG